MRGYYAAIIIVLAAGVATSRIPRKAPVRKPECPSSGTAKLPHSKECNLYYICEDGKSTLQICPEGLHFNNAIKQCDWPEFAECSGTDRPETQPNIPGDDEDISGCIGTCPLPDPMDRTIHLPYGGDCTKFCKCSNGIPFIMDCPDKLYFDEEESVCNWPWIAKCQ